jgi:putative endonuclease
MMLSMEKKHYLYILASKRNGTLYVGSTDDLARRIWEHKNELVEGFTKKYHVNRLVYCEAFDRKYDALQHELRIKKWDRAWKLKLIEERNPEWDDLNESLFL